MVRQFDNFQEFNTVKKSVKYEKILEKDLIWINCISLDLSQGDK